MKFIRFVTTSLENTMFANHQYKRLEMAETDPNSVPVCSSTQAVQLKKFARQHSKMSSKVAREDSDAHNTREGSANAADGEPFLEDDDLKLEKEDTASPQLEAAVFEKHKKWYRSPAWPIMAVALLCVVMVQNAILFFAACGYEDGFNTDLGKPLRDCFLLLLTDICHSIPQALHQAPPYSICGRDPCHSRRQPHARSRTGP